MNCNHLIKNLGLAAERQNWAGRCGEYQRPTPDKREQNLTILSGGRNGAINNFNDIVAIFSYCILHICRNLDCRPELTKN
jgi:hypothetical protein